MRDRYVRFCAAVADARGLRHVALSIKAKLESGESGIEEFESAFMAQVVMPSGKKFCLFCQFFLESYLMV